MIAQSTTHITSAVVLPCSSTTRPEWILPESTDLIPASLHIELDAIGAPSLGTGLSAVTLGFVAILASTVAACGF